MRETYYFESILGVPNIFLNPPHFGFHNVRVYRGRRGETGGGGGGQTPEAPTAEGGQTCNQP